MYRIKLTNEEIDEYIILHRAYRKDQRKADRIKAILLLNKGYGEKEVAEILLLDKENHLRMVLPGKEEGLVRRMKEDIALLQKQYDKERKHKK